MGYLATSYIWLALKCNLAPQIADSPWLTGAGDHQQSEESGYPNHGGVWEVV